jgi:hypothetical protein
MIPVTTPTIDYCDLQKTQEKTCKIIDYSFFDIRTLLLIYSSFRLGLRMVIMRCPIRYSLSSVWEWNGTVLHFFITHVERGPIVTLGW